MTREEAIFCEKSYIGETNCTDCKYYGTDTCQSRESHRMAVKALEQESKTGHWIEEFNDLEGEVRFTCSSCGKYQLFGTDFCYNCGSDNREVE